MCPAETNRISPAESFATAGYLRFDPEIPEAVLDGVIEDLADEFLPEPGEPASHASPPGPAPSLATRLARRLRPAAAPEQPLAEYRDPIRIRNAWQDSANVKAIARAPRVLQLLAELFEREPRPWQTINFRVGTEQAVHSDAFHFNSDPPGFMCGVWVALEDVDRDNGPLVYFPGSHRLPELTPAAIGKEAGAGSYPAYEAHIRELTEREGLDPQYGDLRKGEALVWASNLLHGGAPQRDASRTRLSQVTHYFFEGCRYWTPMASDAGHTEWRSPYWIV
jgi:Phytanoyl-CoA dioxygenase (PhyH)